MKCPHCKSELTVRESIEIMHGDQLQKFVKVRTPSGRITHVEAGSVNPRAVEIIEQGQ